MHQVGASPWPRRR